MYESEHFESPVKVPSYSLPVSKANAFRISNNNLRLTRTKISPRVGSYASWAIMKSGNNRSEQHFGEW
jgi:hypothetical protein